MIKEDDYKTRYQNTVLDNIFHFRMLNIEMN